MCEIDSVNSKDYCYDFCIELKPTLTEDLNLSIR